jgi:DNA polymerase-3 subunit beta
MEIRLNRAELLSELVPMQGIVERRTTIPALSHLLLRAKDGRLHLAATDLDVSLTSSCDGDIRAEGAIAIQAKKLLEIMRVAVGAEVSLRIDQEGVLTIHAGPSLFKIRGLAADEFPSLPDLEAEDAVELPFGIFRAMIGKIFFAISNEESRFQLSGALLRFSQELMTLVATDGHRLALVESTVEGLTPREGIIVPRKALQELQRFEGDQLSFRRSEHHLSFSIGRRQLICRILEGAFPDYERVIAKNQDKILIADRRELAGVVQRVSLLTGERARVIRVELDEGKLTLSAANPDLGEAREEVAVDYAGGHINIGLNPDYLANFLGVVETEKVRLELKDENSQCLAQPVEGMDKRYLCVIMPIRL